jgi:type II secretory pathway pseudopilin PulG
MRTRVRDLFSRMRRTVPKGEGGFILPLVLMVLLVVGLMATTLLASLMINQQHVSRDRAYTQSLAVAEAGLNQYLWMVAAGKSSEVNNFAISGNTGPDPLFKTFSLNDPYDDSLKGTYSIQVTPPSSSDSRIAVKVTGAAESGVDVPRTVSAHIGRPAFSQYVLLVDDDVYIGGPLDRVWFGKTHSNTGIRIETSNINDTVTCAQSTYSYSGQTKPGIWSQDVPSSDGSRALWSFPVPPVDFGTVTSDFVRLSGLATGAANLPYVVPSPSTAAHGWYIKILPNQQYQVAQVTAEYEAKGYSSGNNRGGYLTYGTLSSPIAYPFKGVIYVNDNVWVEGTDLSGRLTIASSGQLNPAGRQAATSVNIVGDITYHAKDGTVAIGLIGQNNVKIPMYAPMGRSGSLSSMDMEVDCALIAQQGAEFVNFDSSGYSSGWGPRRDTLTLFGSVSSLGTPYRRTSPIDGSSDYAGFSQGENTYDGFLLHNPPPYFPTVGSYQILDWQELPSSQELTPAP